MMHDHSSPGIESKGQQLEVELGLARQFVFSLMIHTAQPQELSDFIYNNK